MIFELHHCIYSTVSYVTSNSCKHMGVNGEALQLWAVYKKPYFCYKSRGLHLNMQWNRRCFVERLLLIVANSTDAEVARIFNFSFNWMKSTNCRLIWDDSRFFFFFFAKRKSSGHWCVLVAHSTNRSWERAVFINGNLNLVLALAWFIHQPQFVHACIPAGFYSSMTFGVYGS